MNSAFYLPLSSTSYSFEIKPKWGSLPKSCLLVITRYPMHDGERVYCRYCMQQYQKVMSGKIHQHSSYCPLKLFQ